MKEPKLNGPSTVEFFINDEKVGEMDIAATVYGAYTGHETFDIGRDEGMPVNEEYADKGKFNLPKANCTRWYLTSRIQKIKWVLLSTALSINWVILREHRLRRLLSRPFGDGPCPSTNILG
jgi:hypothetical protein